MDFILTAPIADQKRLERLERFSSYFLLARETGVSDPEHPYEHCHAFVQLKKSKTVAQVLAIVGTGINVQPRMGTCVQAMEYVMKDGDFRQSGLVTERIAGQGARNDLAAFVDDAKTDTDRDLWVKHTSNMVRYHRAAEKVREAFEEERKCLTEMWWIWGPPGCGKTLFVEQKYPGLYVKDKTKWWQGYVGQEVVLIDELNKPLLSYDMLLELGNKTPLRVETKGGYRQFLARLVVIVSNVCPSLVYQEDLKNNDALLRRVRFYSAEADGPHRLKLTPKEYRDLEWRDKGEPLIREVAYADDVEFEFEP